MVKPLSGKRILVTRSEDQAQIFSEKLEALGAVPLTAPVITFQPRGEKEMYLDRLREFTWLFFTSANGVKFFFQQLHDYDIDLSVINQLHIAVVGNKTNQVLRSYGFSTDFVPERFDGMDMVTKFLDTYGKEERILLISGNLARQEVANELTKQDVFFKRAVVYDTLINENASGLLQKYLEGDIDVVTFTSPSTIQAFIELSKHNCERVNILKSNKLCLCIGDTTQDEAIRQGFKHVWCPNTYTTEAMIEELITYFKEKGK